MGSSDELYGNLAFAKAPCLVVAIIETSIDYDPPWWDNSSSGNEIQINNNLKQRRIRYIFKPSVLQRQKLMISMVDFTESRVVVGSWLWGFVKILGKWVGKYPGFPSRANLQLHPAEKYRV